MNPAEGASTEPASGSKLNRRGFVQWVGLAGMALAGPSLLEACGGSSSTQSTAGVATGKNAETPSRGGVLRVGVLGNGTSETYNPVIVNTPIDTLHCYSVYDPLVRVAPGHRTEPGLITEWIPNPDATVYDLKLREGVTWHDGKPFTADDVIYTLRNMGSTQSLAVASVVNVQLKDLKKLDAHTVRVPLTRPIGDLAGYFIYNVSSYVIQDGAKNFSKPIGTGPYKLQSFTPGQRSVLTANRDYWDSPKPYPDELQIISIDDDTARLNALESGQIDICHTLPSSVAKSGGSNGSYTVVVGTPSYAQLFYMRVDTPPFNDVRVRQAMALAIDRPTMIEAALDGFGLPGNDLVGYGLPYYDSGLPQRVQDIEQAKSLLKAAGQSDLRVTLHTAPAIAGFVQSALALSQQVAPAGITVQVKQEQPSAYFDPSLSYLKESFAQDAWPVAALEAWYAQCLLSTGGLNETHTHSPSFDASFYAAQSATDPTKAQELWSALQRNQWETGGNIVWAFVKTTDAVSPKVRGFGGPGTGWLYGTDDERAWNWGLA